VEKKKYFLAKSVREKLFFIFTPDCSANVDPWIEALDIASNIIQDVTIFNN